MSNIRLKVLATAVPLTLLGLVALIAKIHSREAELSKTDAASLNQTSDFITETDRLLKPSRKIEQSTTTACDKASQSAKSFERAARAAEVLPSYSPRQGKASIHPTNYGERSIKDVYGRPINNQLLVVLHETVASATATINFFQAPHYKDSDQASYHALVTRDGTIIYFVPPEKRAFGAGNSVFEGPNGPETVKTDPNLPPSVNNFAYHISLETPGDGDHNHSSHSGYTEAQYQSLAWLVARTGVADNRITTHEAVDRSGQRQDPRSFELQKFLGILYSYPRPDTTLTECLKQPAI